MKISRIRVEEGFLHGLDLGFVDGLNVLIGPRGSGKTSIIELIRFCLDIPAYSDEIEQAARKFALAILGSGRVSVTLDYGNHESTITREFSEIESPSSPGFPAPTVLSQGEIETIGLAAESRLRLIDSFSDVPSELGVNERSLLAEIRSITSQMQSILIEIQSIEEELESLSEVPDELTAAVDAQTEIMGSVEELSDQQEELSDLSDQTAAFSVRSDVFARARLVIEEWQRELKQLVNRYPKIEAWPDAAQGDDLLEPVRASLQKVKGNLSKGLSAINDEVTRLSELSDVNEIKRLELEQKARTIRTMIEEIEEGAGRAAQKVAQLKEKSGKISALNGLLEERRSVSKSIKNSRNALLTDLDSLRETRFAERVRISTTLNDELMPSIEVRPVRSAQYAEYESAVAETLRGSGLKYKLLAPRIAERMSPREFAEAVEQGDADTIARIVDISPARASKVVAGAQTSGVDAVLTCRVEDGIDLMLLSGGEYKRTDQLSTGQRCTVILPVLLSELGRTLIVDQPEDNLDNAFIVRTVIKSIRAVTSERQIICATHNPNIPVLGDADQVTSLNSDGRRGYVASSAPLDDPESVSAITSVMEGGWEAFRLRAKFYERSIPADE